MHHLMDEPEGAFLVRFHHTVGTGVSSCEYDELYRRVLLNGISGIPKIFLDTNFWVWLRDAREDGSSERDSLLRRLREGARERRLTCVLHGGTFIEFAKQRNLAKLHAIAAIADELCEGVCLTSTEEQRLIEAWSFASEALRVPFDGQVGRWTHVGQMFKSTYPDIDLPMTALTRDVLYKCVSDAAHTTSLTRLINDLGDLSSFDESIDARTVAAVERLKKHSKAKGLNRSTSRVIAFRVALEKDYAAAFEFQMKGHCEAIGAKTSPHDINRWVGDIIDRAVDEFRVGKLGKHLASAAIFADLFALYEVGDPHRSLTPNDWDDWGHAASALPHCDAFFTEVHLASQLNQPNGCAARYRCKVAGSARAALAALDAMGL